MTVYEKESETSELQYRKITAPECADSLLPVALDGQCSPKLFPLTESCGDNETNGRLSQKNN